MQETQVAPITSGDHRHPDGFVAERQFDSPIGIDFFDSRIVPQILDRGRRKERSGPGDFVRRRSDEKIGDQRLVDPIADRLAKRKDHYRDANRHRHRRGQRCNRDCIAEQSAAEILRSQPQLDVLMDRRADPPAEARRDFRRDRRKTGEDKKCRPETEPRLGPFAAPGSRARAITGATTHRRESTRAKAAPIARSARRGAGYRRDSSPPRRGPETTPLPGRKQDRATPRCSKSMAQH